MAPPDFVYTEADVKSQLRQVHSSNLDAISLNIQHDVFDLKLQSLQSEVPPPPPSIEDVRIQVEAQQESLCEVQLEAHQIKPLREKKVALEAELIGHQPETTVEQAENELAAAVDMIGQLSDLSTKHDALMIEHAQCEETLREALQWQEKCTDEEQRHAATKEQLEAAEARHSDCGHQQTTLQQRVKELEAQFQDGTWIHYHVVERDYIPKTVISEDYLTKDLVQQTHTTNHELQINYIQRAEVGQHYMLKTDVDQQYLSRTYVHLHYTSNEELAQSYYLKTDVEACYTPNEEVERSYLPRTTVNAEYTSNADVEQHYTLTANIPTEWTSNTDVSSLYVTKEDYNVLRNIFVKRIIADCPLAEDVESTTRLEDSFCTVISRFQQHDRSMLLVSDDDSENQHPLSFEFAIADTFSDELRHMSARSLVVLIWKMVICHLPNAVSVAELLCDRLRQNPGQLNSFDICMLTVCFEEATAIQVDLGSNDILTRAGKVLVVVGIAQALLQAMSPNEDCTSIINALQAMASIDDLPCKTLIESCLALARGAESNVQLTGCKMDNGVFCCGIEERGVLICYLFTPEQLLMSSNNQICIQSMVERRHEGDQTGTWQYSEPYTARLAMERTIWRWRVAARLCMLQKLLCSALELEMESDHALLSLAWGSSQRQRRCITLLFD